MRFTPLLCSLLVLAATVSHAGGASGRRAQRTRATAPAAAAPAGPRVLRLSEAAAAPIVVRAGNDTAVYVSFPAGSLASVDCGACTITPAQAEEAGPSIGKPLFAIRVFKKENYLSIQALGEPKEQRGDGPPAARYRTNAAVALKDLTAPLLLTLVYADEPDAAVRIVPEEGDEQSAAAAKRIQQLEAEWRQRVKDAELLALRNAFAMDHQCKRLRGSRRERDVVLDMEELCRFGRRFVLTFTLTNRSRDEGAVVNLPLDPTAQGEVQGVWVYTRNGEHLVSVDNQTQPVFSTGADKRQLLFGERTRASVAFEVPEKDKESAFEVRFAESGGMRRELVLSDVSF